MSTDRIVPRKPQDGQDMTDDHVTRFVTSALDGMDRLGIDCFGEWMRLHVAEYELVRHLVLIPSGDADQDAHRVRTAGPNLLLQVLKDPDTDRDRLAALLYAYKTVDSMDDGHAVIDRLEEAWTRGVRT